MRAGQLAELIGEKNDRESEINILQDEFDRRLVAAVSRRWVPNGLRDM